MSDETAYTQEVQRMQKAIEEYDIDLEHLHTRAAYPRLIGIYFLFSRERLAYIGQSRNIIYRVMFHEQSKKFDAFAILECPTELLTHLEAHFIVKFSPPLNNSVPSNPLYKSAATLKSMIGIGACEFLKLVKRHNIQLHSNGTNMYNASEVFQALEKESAQ